MSGVLLICISLMVSAGAAGDLDMDALPFSVNEVIEQTSHNTRLNYHGNLPVNSRGSTTSWPLLDEFMIDTSITYVGNPLPQDFACLAFDGTNYFVVWHDWRSVGGDIYGARVDTSGVVLDPSGILISGAPYTQEFPSVTFGGTSYFVAWSDRRSDNDYDIYGTRVDISGVVLDPSGVAVCTANNDQWYSSLAFDGTNYLVVWADWRSGNAFDIYGARVDTSGTVLDSSGIAITTAADRQWIPSLAFDGTNYLVVWDDHRSPARDIYGARVSTSGTVLDSSGIPICTSVAYQMYPSVAFDGANYLVVWEDYRGGTDPDIYGARVDTSGTVLDSSGIAISTAADRQWTPSLAFDGTNYLVAWADWRSGNDFDIYGARVDTSGVVLDLQGIVISNAPDDQALSCLASDGSNYLVAWQDRRNGINFGIYGARVDTSGTVLDSMGVNISTAASYQWLPSAGFDGSNYFVVWTDWRSGNDSDIYGARVGQSGAVLDPSGIAISTAADRQWIPSLAFDGTNYLVVWDDYRNGFRESDIYGARVDSWGSVLDPLGMAISTAPDWQDSPAVAFGRTSYLVVWERHRGGNNYDILGARVDTSGVVLDTLGVVICAAPDDQRFPSIAFDGTNYLVVWSDQRSGADSDIYGVRVDTSGTVLDSSGIAISTAADLQWIPSIAFDGTNYLVVWDDLRSGTDSDIYGTRVDTSGRVLDPTGIVIFATANRQGSASVAFDGTNYLVVWEDCRDLWECDIYGARVDTSGTVLDPSGTELINQPYARLNPSIAVGAPDQLLLVYDGFADEPYNTNRVFGAFYTETGIAEHKGKIKNQNAKLFQNMPNPFHLQTTIKYQIPDAGGVSLRAYDSSGRLVKVLVDEEKPAGSYASRWDGKNISGQEVPSGVYFCRLQTGEFVSTRKVILVR